MELALATAATDRLLIGPGVTNPLTRHPAVTASAAATLQAESDGRTVLGFGRGDSALSQIGLEPVHVKDFERALAEVQGFLRGEEVRLANGFDSTNAWIAGTGQPKVPVAVAASGKHVIEAAARHADQIDFTVGAEEGRLRWAIETADAAGATGTFGAFINVAVDEDVEAARDLVRGSTSILARFAAEGSSLDGLSEVTRTGIEELAAGYEEAEHGKSSAGAAQAMSPEFIDRFAVCGPPDEVAERLAALAGLGIDRLIVVPGSLDADPAAVDRSNELFAAEVLPRLTGR